MNNQNKAYLFASFAVFMWATIASAFKITLRYLNFINLLFYSSLVSLIVLFIIIIIQNKTKRVFELNKRDFTKTLFLGFLNPFLYYLILLKAYSILPAQIAQPLNFTWPVILSILAIFILKQKIKIKSILAILVSFSGIYVISTNGKIFDFKFTNPFGVALAVGSAFIWAFFWIYNTKDKREPAIKLFLNFLIGTPLLFISILLFDSFQKLNLNSVIGVVYIGLFEMGITFFMWLKALELAENTAKIGNLVYLAPFISLIFIHIFVGEKILISTIIGLILILLGIVFQKLSS